MSDQRAPMTSTDSVCAIVVAYYPDDNFPERIKQLLPQTGLIVIVDNTPEILPSRHYKDSFNNVENIYLIENHSNTGIAAALNQGLEQAIKAGYRWALTLDQDTQCHSDIVTTLLNVKNTCALKPSVIGGNYFDPRSQQLNVRNDKSLSFIEQKTVITSGCLIDVHLATKIGGFREDFFIDQVDHEFCLRMRAHGYKVVISCKPVMDHSVGAPGGVQLPFLGVLPNHPPLRKYYIARNSLVTVSEYWQQEPAWCLRRLARLILGVIVVLLLEENPSRKIKAFYLGINDALRRNMGAAED